MHLRNSAKLAPVARIADGETLFERWIIEKMVGEGTFGRVYFAHDKFLPRSVAIKELKSRWLGESAVVTRFWNEAQAVARLQHPNIVTIIDRRPLDEPPQFIILERLTESLRDLMNREGPLSVLRSTRIAADICSALELAHAHGIIH